MRCACLCRAEIARMTARGLRWAVVLFAIITVSALEAQSPKPKPKPAERPAAPRPREIPTGTLLLSADQACTLNVDGRDIGSVKANEVRRLVLPPGEHLVQAQIADSVVWSGTVEVRAGSQKA